MNISHENKQLSAGSNMLKHPLKKKHWRCFHFLSHLVFYIFPHIWNAPLNSIAGKRYLSNFCFTSFPRKVLLFSTNWFHNGFSNRVSFFAWQFQVRLCMKPVFLVKTSGKMSLTFQTCSMGSEKFRPLFDVICVTIFEGFIDKALRVFIPLQCISSWMLTANTQQ